MKRIILVLGISALVFLSLIAVALAGESTVLSDLRGESQYGGSLVLKGSDWKSAPENPQTVYVALLVSEPRLSEAIKSSLYSVIRSHNLTPEFVYEPMNYDLKGQLVVVFLPHSFSRNRILYIEYGVSGILYYSYAGDAKTFVEIMTDRNTPKETKESLEKLATELKVSSVERLNEEHIMNQTVSVAYWWNLKAKVGKLSKANPYELIASEIASQLDDFLKES